jgi:hypothetical protein
MADQSQHPNDTASGTEEFDQVWHEYLLAEAAITLPKPDDEMDAAVDRLSQCEWDVITGNSRCLIGCSRMRPATPPTAGSRR